MTFPAETMNTLTRGVQRTVLDNGLTVLIKEIHTAPVVSVQVWYRVGSRNEGQGLNGISHQLEHLLFKGTQSRPIQFGRLFSALGSASNAFTSYDMTAYFGTVSSDKLDALLVLEADRMRHALINEEQLETEKRVVISELQGYDNSPEYRLAEAVMRQAFPGRAYGLPVGGTKTDVEGFTVEQVRDYYQTYYSPENAVLAVAGDFDPSKLQATIKQTFGMIPAASHRDGATVAVSLPSHGDRWEQSDRLQTPIHLRQPGSAALIEAVYPIPHVGHPDIPALDVMDAVLSVGRNSRFFETLIEPGLASHVNSYSAALIEPGWYNVSAALIPGQTIQAVDRVLLQTISEIQQSPISDEELERAKQQLMTHFIMSNRDVDSQASQLAYSEMVAGDYRYSDQYLAKIQQVSAADVQRVAQTYLEVSQRTVGYFEPTELDEAADLGSSPQQTIENFTPSEPVDPAEVAQYLPPLNLAKGLATQALPQTLTLPNGLRVLLLRDPSSPTVTLNGNIQAGNGLDLLTKPGVAGLTAETVLGGTTADDALALAKRLEDRGVSLDFSAFREGVEIEGHGLAADLTLLLKTLAQVLQQAVFPEPELELSRKQVLSSLHMELDDPARLARRTLQQKIYPPDHPFYPFPTLETVQSITRDDVLAFYHQHYRPDHTVLALVGDFDLAQVQTQIQSYFGAWHSSSAVPTLKVPQVELPAQTNRLQVPLSGKSQSVTYMGYPSIERRDPRYHAAMVLNQILGGDTLSSRLGAEIRDRQGLTYGIYSYFAAGQTAGPFVIEMQTAPEDTEQAVNSTLALLQHLRQNGILEAELSTAKRSLINSYPVELANPDVIAHRMLMNAVDGFGPEEIYEFPHKIELVTMEHVNQAIHDLIQPDHLLIVTAGPA